MRKLNGITFDYTYWFHLVLLEFTLIKIGFIQTYKQQEPWSNKNHPHKFPVHCNVQHQVLYEIQHGPIGLLHFQKGILPSHVTDWISLSKTSVCLEGYVLLYNRKRMIYWYWKWWEKICTALFPQKFKNSWGGNVPLPVFPL